MFKIVNIYPKFPVITVNPPIRSSVRKVTKSTDEIRACIIARAIVEEVLPDGSTIILDLNNFDKDNIPKPANNHVAAPEKPAPVAEAKSNNRQYDNTRNKKNKKHKYNRNSLYYTSTSNDEEETTTNESEQDETDAIETKDVENL